MLNTLLFGFAVSLIIALALGPLVIRELKKFHARQSEREEGPESHKYKAGTPTMGGILILTALVVSCLIFNPMDLRKGLALFLTLGHGVIGFLDDSIKAVKHRNLGLTARQKLAGQFVMAAVFCFILKEYLNFPTTVWIPFTTWNIDFGMAYYAFVFIMIVGTSNAVNLTDGLDGLCTSVTILVATFLTIVAIGEDMGISPITGAVVGSLLGFLLFNVYPAKVFMGDTGSLALGGFVASAAYMMRLPLFIPIIGLIYLVEVLSVIIQVTYFKKTGGKRIFKMAPIHHHFELCGWSETRVVAVFSIVTAILCMVAYLGL